MKKIVQRTRRFEKHFKKLNPKLQGKFIEKLKLFMDDEFHPSLNTHKLKGKHQKNFAFSLTDDIRAIYNKEIRAEKITIIFTFIDIGTHNLVYK